MTFSMMDAFSAHFLLYSYAVFFSRKFYFYLKLCIVRNSELTINMYFPVFATSLYIIDYSFLFGVLDFHTYQQKSSI
jgi:hypothetical protein